MSTPTPITVREQIAQSLVEAINGVDPLAGYFSSLKAVRPDRLGNDIGDGTVVVHFGAEDYRDLQSCQVIEKYQEFLFQVLVMLPEGTPEVYDRQIGMYEADIWKAVSQDVTRGGWAHDTLYSPPEWFRRSEGLHEGVVARCFCRYRHSYTDPYQAR